MKNDADNENEWHSDGMECVDGVRKVDCGMSSTVAATILSISIEQRKKKPNTYLYYRLLTIEIL